MYSIIECSVNQALTEQVVNILHPCNSRQKRFPDALALKFHVDSVHVVQQPSTLKDPKQMSVPELKGELKKRKLLATGTKAVLLARLQGALASEG